ncbi:MAG TPA: hypothetical protein VKU94_03215 [Geobacterales bacterium]|nr:hypothetical protein [Geobacterales bacterium]
MRHNFLLVTFLVFLLDYILTFVLADWRIVILAGAIGGLLYTSKLKSFAAGFTGTLIAWIALMVPILVQKNNLAITSILASIVGFPQALLLALVFIIPSLVGAFACLATTTLRQLISQ